MNSEDNHARLYFLDNVRWIMIARVVVFHVAAGYSALPEFYNETQAGGAIAIVRNIVHALPGMNVLFFIAGYFALHSLKRKTYTEFISSKLFTLGIPYLLCIFFLGPVMPYLGYYSQSFNGLHTDSYWQFWFSLIADGFGTEITSVVFTTNQQFHPMHFWFLSLLLQFFLIFTITHAAWTKWGPKPAPEITPVDTSTDSQRVNVQTLLLAAFCMIVFQGLVGLLDLPGGLIFGILKIDPFSISTHGGFFAFGVFACSQGWFIRLKPPGWWAFCTFSAITIALATLGIWLFRTMSDDIPGYVFSFLYPVWMTMGGIWFLTVMVGLTYRYMNNPSAMNTLLARASYPVYLIHYPLILVFRLILIDVDFPTVAKFFIVLILAASSSLLLAHYLLRPRPIATTVLLVGMHVFLLTVGLPQSSWSHELLKRRAELHAVVPQQQPYHVNGTRDVENEDEGFFSRPSTMHACWQNEQLYTTTAHGLGTIKADGTTHQFDLNMDLGALAPRPKGGLFAVDRTNNSIVLFNKDTHVDTTIVASIVTHGKLGHLASDTVGGLFVSTRGDSGGVFYLTSNDKTLNNVAKLLNPAGLALHPNGKQLWITRTGDYTVWVFDVTESGILSNKRAFAELFRADARYSRDDLERIVDASPEGMTADRAGGLYVTTRFGLQVFSPKGRLLGVMNFPDVPLRWNHHRPFTSTFGGPQMSTLYVTCWQSIFALKMNVSG